MATVNSTLSKSEIISRFGVVVRDYIVSQTNWVTATGIAPGQTVGTITNGTGPAGNGAPGVLPSGKSQATTDPGLPNIALVGDTVEADITSTSSITKVLRDMMVIYARNQRVLFSNTGNLEPLSISGKVRLSTSNGLDTTMTTQINNAINNRQLTGNSTISASQWESFFLDCRTIWNTTCNTPNVATYKFYYCHSSHVNHTSHGSRGRR